MALADITEPMLSIISVTKTVPLIAEPRASGGKFGCTLCITTAGTRTLGVEFDPGKPGWANEFQFIAKLIGRRFSSLGRTRTTIVDQLFEGPGASTTDPSAMFSSFMNSTRHGKPLRFPVT